MIVAITRGAGARLGPHSNAIAMAVVVSALAVSYWWSFEFTPAHVRNNWGTYVVSPGGRLLVAGVAWACCRRLPRPVAEQAVEQRTVLAIAALLGAFLVAIQFLLGMAAGFGVSPYGHSVRWLAMNSMFAGSTILLVETGRAAILRSLGPRSLTTALVLGSVGLAVLQFPPSRYNLDGLSTNAEFWGSIFIPLASAGLLAGFFILYGGIRAGLCLMAPTVAFQYFSPILPVASWPLVALAGVAGPAMGLWIAEALFAADEPAPASDRFLRLPSVAWVLTAVAALAIFWFSFGFFGFRPAFVPTHSMEPGIKKGDAVLIGPVNPDDVAVGQVLLYQMPGAQKVLHRVVAIVPGATGERQFIFKGDNNNAEDMAPVDGKQIIGRYLGRIPRLGWVPMKVNQLIARALK